MFSRMQIQELMEQDLRERCVHGEVCFNASFCLNISKVCLRQHVDVSYIK